MAPKAGRLNPTLKKDAFPGQCKFPSSNDQFLPSSPDVNSPPLAPEPPPRTISTAKRESTSTDSPNFTFQKILLALEYLHTHGIVYGELKPENILLDAVGHIAICNFNLVVDHKRWDEDNDPFHNINEYMAPEVLLARHYLTNVADFWSLAVLFWAITHRSLGLFYHEDREQMARNILFEELRFPPDNISVGGKNFMKQLFNRDPKRRLGANYGAEELKAHPFLADVNWDALVRKAIMPPFNPLLNHQTPVLDLGFVSPNENFPHDGGTAPQPMSTPFTFGMRPNFKGFTFVDE